MRAFDHFRIAVEATGPAPTVVVSGELDLAAAPAFRDALRRGLRSADGRMDVDLRAAEFMDSTALAVLLEGSQAAERAGARLRVTVQDGEVSRMLTLTGVEEWLDVVHLALGTP
jgi:anti-sigma B factor antagonist